MEQRDHFTFFVSFYNAAKRIKKKTDRADFYDAICAYAMLNIEPDMDSLPDVVAIAFDLIRPVLDNCKVKAANRSKSSKQSETKSKQNENKTERTVKDKEGEGEGERDKEMDMDREVEKDSDRKPFPFLSSQIEVIPPNTAFSVFWQNYPNTRGGGMSSAWEAWKTLNPDQAQVDSILAALDVYKSSQDWKDQDGKYIPSAKNFLLNRYWEKPPKLSGQCSLGKAEFDAIQRILTEDYDNESV